MSPAKQASFHGCGVGGFVMSADMRSPTDRERHRRHDLRLERHVVQGDELGLQLVLSWWSGYPGVESGRHGNE